MVHKRFENPQGPYINKEGKRYDVMSTVYAFTPEGLNVGWEEYPSTEAALIAWGLTYDPLPEPELYPHEFMEGEESGLDESGLESGIELEP
jgi:hypothetical protein